MTVCWLVVIYTGGLTRAGWLITKELALLLVEGLPLDGCGEERSFLGVVSLKGGLWRNSS
jgi:hypothetical protein